MSAIEVRPFRRGDQDQLAQLVADDRAFLPAAGFQELTQTRRGWTRTPDQT